MQKDGLSWIVNSDKVKSFSKNERVLELTGGVDYYYIYGYKNTISAGGGSDRILLAGNGQSDYSVVSLDAGDDAVEVNSYGCSIYGGKGNDRIILQTDLTYADGQDGDDKFNLQGTYVSDLTLIGGAGNDTFNFINNSSNVTISGGSGSDVYNFDPEDSTYSFYSDRKLYKNFVTITDIEAEDTIRNNYYKSDGTELSYSTNDSGDIVLEDDYGLVNVTLKGVKDISEVAGVTYKAYKSTKTLGEIFGVDSNSNSNSDSNSNSNSNSNVKYNSSNYTIFSGSASADEMSNSGSYVSICGGSGDDTITNSGSNVVYQFNPSTDGNDVIYGFNSTDTLQVPNSIKSYSWKNVGNDKVITIGGKSITLKNAAYMSKINVYTGYNAGSSDNGTAYNNSSNSIIFSGSSSADKISNSGSYVSIRGGSGNDTITNSGSNVVYQFNPSTDGNDVIYGFNSTDTIQVPNSIKSYSWKNVGSDRVITISGQSITLKNAASISKVNVYTGYNASSSRNYFEERNFVEDHWFTQEDDGFKNEIDSMMNSSNEKASITIKDDLTSLDNPLQSKPNQMTITHSDLNKK